MGCAASGSAPEKPAEKARGGILVAHSFFGTHEMKGIKHAAICMAILRDFSPKNKALVWVGVI